MPRYGHAELVEFATTLLAAGGLERPMAACVARVLVEADLLGHDTHGLAQCPDYIEELSRLADESSLPRSAELD